MMPSQKIDPYQPCPCGSGRKYKFCCRAKEVAISQESPRSLIRKSAEYPVAQCVVGEGWQENGLASIFVVRQLPNQKYIFGSDMVDTLCLGLKDTFCNPNMHASAIQGMFTRAPMEFESIDYEDARSLILGAIEYARNLGFEPNPDWKDSQYVVESTRPFVPKYEFGRNGQPFYIQGPHDNVSQIMSKLSKFKSDFMIVKEPHHE